MYPIKCSLQGRQNGGDGVSNHQPRDCLLNRLFRRRSKKISKFRVTGFCAGNSPVTGEFPAQRASNAENVPIWWRHHMKSLTNPQISTSASLQLGDRYTLYDWCNWLFMQEIKLIHVPVYALDLFEYITPDSKVHGANMGPHVGPMNFVIWDSACKRLFIFSY